MTYEELVRGIGTNAQPGEVFTELRAIGRVAHATITIEQDPHYDSLQDVLNAAMHLHETTGAGLDLFAYYDTGHGDSVRRIVGTLASDPNYDTERAWVN